MTREEAIDILFGCIEAHSEEENEALDIAIEALKGVCFDEWCDDCKEYDTEKKCCPRFNRVIREALKREPSEDGTLEVKVEDATKIGRVLISDDKHRGGLYYPDKDEPKGDDLISRAEAIEAMGEEPPVWCDEEYEIAERNQWRDDVEAIKSVPSADRPRPIEPTITVDLESGVVPISACEPKEPKTIIYADRTKGEWIHTPNGIDRDFVWWTCSECGHKIFSETEKDRIEFHAYCGRCGAYMRGDTERC